MAEKWTVIDDANPQQLLIGTLRKKYLFEWDGDLNFQIEPDDAYKFLLNHDGTPNKDGRVECEVETLDRYEDEVLSSFDIFTDAQVTAIGIWVNDKKHGNKTELHPLDALYGKMPYMHRRKNTSAAEQAKILAADSLLFEHSELRLFEWMNAYRNNYDESDFIVHRIFASADQSDSKHPPFSEITRPVKIKIPVPPHPPGNYNYDPHFQYDIRSRANCKISEKFENENNPSYLEITITNQCFLDADGEKVETGSVLFDVVTGWKYGAEIDKVVP